jgi:hypothetical protein
LHYLNYKVLKINTIILINFIFTLNIFAQKVNIYGRVTANSGVPIENVSVQNLIEQKGVITDKEGNYNIIVRNNDYIKLKFSHLSYKDTIITLTNISASNLVFNISLLESSITIDSTVIVAQGTTKVGTTELKPVASVMLPTVNSSIEDLIKTLPGTFSRNELTSNYSVRGGNYDENLVYVNEFEIYRPLLISSSRQEGLSFVNPDMVQSISFASGGFEPKYGDKLSSVLNIRYRRPTERFAGSVTASLLNTALNFEGISKNNKLSYLVGARYKTSAYLLGSLDQKGEYNNRFLDVQSNVVYSISDKLSLEFLFAHNNNSYNFLPAEQSTTTGTFNQVIRLTVYFDGEEKTAYHNSMGGMALRWMPSKNSIIKWLNSGWYVHETEKSNVIGGYFLDEIESDFDSDNFGNVKQNLGIGTYHDWSRNTLDGWFYNTQVKGSHLLGSRHTLDWGTGFQTEHFDDVISEWERVDSAGYSLPYTNSQVNLFNRLKSGLNLDTWRIQGYIQDIWKLIDGENRTKVDITYGARYHYYGLNKQFLVSPRMQLYVKPKFKNEVAFKMAVGMYGQPPFYRELRNLDGVINPSVKAQQSLHVIAGTEVNFLMFKRPFKFTAETYYKNLYQLNPYEFDDVRIRYYAQNNATGYATGVDVRLFGEFVKGTDSWVTLSYLNTKENLKDDKYTEYYNSKGEIVTPYIEDQIITDSTIIYPGNIRRPTDQHFMMSIFFQDYLVKNKNFKMHLALTLGTGLPYGTPDGKRYNDVFTMPLYRRVDIGFSWMIIDNAKKKQENLSKFGKAIEKIWLSAEVLNLLGAQNTLSYKWIKDVNNTLWPMPNYLTSRRFNVKLYVKF